MPRSLDTDSGGDEMMEAWMKGLVWGRDGEEVGCTKESRRENERFKVHRGEADWFEGRWLD